MDDCKVFCGADTLCFIGYFFGLVSFLITFNVEGMPWLPYPLVGNLQDLDHEDPMLPDFWEQGVVLIVLFWGISYIRKAMLVILKQISGREELHAQNQILSRQNNNYEIYTIGSPAPNSSGVITTSELDNDATNCYIQNVASYVAPTIAYHTIFGIWIGWACNAHESVEYRSSDIEWLGAGALLWVLSEMMIITVALFQCWKKKEIYQSDG